MTFQKIPTTSAQPVPFQKMSPVEVTPLWGILRDLRTARVSLGLKDRTVTILQAMISLLPKDNSRTRVFASNLTLSDRANGMTERTMRRHISVLVDLGLIERHDSANRKRFARRDPDSGDLIGYGFDLSPLLRRAEEIASLAAETAREAGRISILRDRLSELRQQLLERDDAHGRAEKIRKVLRRKLTAAQLTALTAEIEQETLPATPALSTNVSVNDSQIDRHIQRSYTKEFESKEPRDKPTSSHQTKSKRSTWQNTGSHQSVSKDDHGQYKEAIRKNDISLADLKSTCPEIFCFAIAPVLRWREMDSLGRSVGRMAGITEELLDQAEARFGPSGLALTIAAMMQMGTKIRSHGAYLRSLVSGKNASGFDPAALVARMSRSAG